MNSKELPEPETYVDDENHCDNHEINLKGTNADERDMQILGKSQELNVSISKAFYVCGA
jgi:hypothetical protein